ncbi:WGR domain-containing protein [Roseivivax halotolerans]|uniref:WGR domain-containing protein n=1 Tax=Roseivivax halotolerans TaxID=93684 RepID=A0A1I6A599_9RHOB|nr:WGR domain-containing protein [Roseivivax halotolerans]SFQ63904.1 WGR domain-containing protein [Roseivivax halotolerans]
MAIGTLYPIALWGRNGWPGQMRTDWFDSEREAKDARFELHMAKARRGYL